MKERIIEMLKIQEALDNSFLEYMGRTEPLTIEEVRIALFDELGEVCHEMKEEWCYWKKSQKPVDRDKLKEELADVWHFALTLHRLRYKFEFNYLMYGVQRNWFEYSNWYRLIESIVEDYIIELYRVIILTEKLGFTFDEMYQAYIEKNKVNYERMKEGY